MDKRAMSGLVKDMESIAENVLQQDSSFFEALQALKSEMDANPQVKAAVRGLRAAGQTVFSSFVPRIKIRVKTEEGIFPMTKPPAVSTSSVFEPVASLAQEIRRASRAVIIASRYCRELEQIVNEAMTASNSFQNLACQIESAGFEVLISLDISAYSQIQPTSGTPNRISPPLRSSSDEPATMELSSYDVGFLKLLKIRTDENLPI